MPCHKSLRLPAFHSRRRPPCFPIFLNGKVSRHDKDVDGAFLTGSEFTTSRSGRTDTPRVPHDCRFGQLLDHRPLSRQQTRQRQQFRSWSRPSILPSGRPCHGKRSQYPTPHMPLLPSQLNQLPLAQEAILRQPRPRTQPKLLLHLQASPDQKCLLHSEYDVLAHSFLLLQEYTTATPAIIHVERVTRTTKSPIPNLPLPAQLNCDADGLATTELRTLPNQIRRAPLFK
jgi:hypothetical protein